MQLLNTLFVLFSLFLSAISDDFRYGRATFYGNEPWYWSIHKGSCEYYYLCKDESTGWHVTALPDVHYEYQGSCGRCYEVQCNPTWFNDGFGNSLDRTHVCRDPEASVIVQVTDTCPCQYANNAYSNKRWCCGDMDHLDLSIWAWEKLSYHKWGVIGIKYRPVDCYHQPWKRAYAPPEGEHWGEDPWAYGASCPRYNRP